MHVEYLSYVRIPVWSVGIAAPIQAVVRYDNHLKHVVVQSQCHLIECAYVLVQRGDGEDIRLMP